jgi:peroxin-1
VVLDDLDLLCSAPPAGDAAAAAGGAADASQALAQSAVVAVVRDTLTSLAGASGAGAGVAVIASAASVDRLALPLRQTGLFADASVLLKPPGLAAREEMIRSILAAMSRSRSGSGSSSGRSRSSHNRTGAVTLAPALAARLAAQTEGYSPQDLTLLLHRALHAALTRPDTSNHTYDNGGTCATVAPAAASAAGVGLTSADLAAASAGFVNSALQSLSLSAKPQVSWSDIGGLADVKETLIETLELPARFARVFKTVPLKLRSGILLYGPPGCGKTMMASAVAAQCGLNFISVKGPELLNKYIGASEENVRALFARAAAAAPCVLFFDEFDSIAPKRGGDSTGVTDRVVNQFLCQLDGVEGREGVYVLAASSRPDLIDAALLRPGRLDKAIYCPVPETPEERLEVLCALGKFSRAGATDDDSSSAGAGANAGGGAWVTRSHRLVLGADADIAAVAAATVDMTAADLGGVIKNAALAAVREVEAKALRGEEITDADERGGRPVVYARHFTAAVDGTAVSLSRKERERFARIYRKFISSKNPTEAETEFDPHGHMMTATK